MNRKVKVLQINASSKYGGVSAMILNYSRYADLTKFSFDFLSPDETSYTSFIDEIVQKLDGNVYELGVKFKGINKYRLLYKKFNLFLKDHSYDVVHINSGILFYNLEMAYIAKKNGVNKIIVHSHNAIQYKGIKKVVFAFLKKFIPCVATDYLACSKKAAESMFPAHIIETKKYEMINNAIDTSKFKYNVEVRKRLREELQLDGKFVVGHIGRFVTTKNHKFLLEIFYEILKIKSNSVLLLLGEGELYETIKNLAKEMGIYENIRFVGQIQDTSPYYQVFDAFVLPSFYEGLPVVSVEAQASGLPCFLSDSITNECAITQNVHFLSLKDSSTFWAKKIISISEHFDRKDTSEDVAKSGYDISHEAKKMENIYLRKG